MVIDIHVFDMIIVLVLYPAGSLY